MTTYGVLGSKICRHCSRFNPGPRVCRWCGGAEPYRKDRRDMSLTPERKEGGQVMNVDSAVDYFCRSCGHTFAPSDGRRPVNCSCGRPDYAEAQPARDRVRRLFIEKLRADNPHHPFVAMEAK